MIAYKGFHPGLICRGYQFVMGLNVTEQANCAANGFHCAENPLDCLSYYPDMKQSAGSGDGAHQRHAGHQSVPQAV